MTILSFLASIAIDIYTEMQPQPIADTTPVIIRAVKHKRTHPTLTKGGVPDATRHIIYDPR